jgi:hypothetical protein
MSSWLQHLASSTRDALSWIPGWALILVLVAGFALLIRRALRTRHLPTSPDTEPVLVEEHPRDQQR